MNAAAERVDIVDKTTAGEKPRLRPTQEGNVRLAAVATVAATLGMSALPAAAQTTLYIQVNLVANTSGYGAARIDPNLINPWGMSATATSPWWVSDNGAGKSTLYNGSGVPQALIVTIPPAPGSPVGTLSTPTGQVANTTTDFQLTPGSNPARFIFATEDGTISGWNPAVNANTSVIKVDNSGSGAVYKGLALGNNGTSNFLYAADFFHNRIDVFNNAFGSTSLSGNFTDPSLPAGFSPFNIQNIGGQLFVAYAAQDPASHADELPGAGFGIVDVFDLNGNFVKRLATGTPSGPLADLNDPWGFALAPSNFGEFSNALLVGQFGNGKILAFNPTTNAFLGALTGFGNTPLVIDGLWGIGFGNGAASGPTNVLYFSAGPNGENDGLFGVVAVAGPEPGSLSLLSIIALGALSGGIRRRRRARAS